MAQYEEFTIDKGSDVSIELHLVEKDGTQKDLTNHTVAAKLKKTYGSDSADTTEFGTVIGSPATAGITTLSLTNEQTGSLKAGRYVYDVEVSFLDSDSTPIVERILEGRIQVSPSVTR